MRLPRFGRRPKGGPPAPFVVGVGRSGTTLLRLMLDAHPELVIPAETQFLEAVLDHGGRGRRSSQEIVELITGSRNWEDFGLEERRLRERVAKLGEPAPAEVLRAFYGLCAEEERKPRWGDKTPGHVKRMRSIAAVLDEARFIHLIRDGRDVAISRRRRGMGADKPMSETARLWRERIGSARRQAKRLRGRYIEVRFEDLVAEPEPALRRICEFAELDFDPAMLAHESRARSRVAELGRDLPGDGGRIARTGDERLAAHELAASAPTTARTAVWRNQMNERDLVEFEAVAGDLLRELGYEVAS